MKNQYFGDINDYRKYGLIRLLSGNGHLRVGVCWMLTESDNRTDGKFTEYLEKGQRYRRYDGQLFDTLKDCLAGSDGRNVCNAATRAVIPGAVYYDTILTDGAGQRRQYFEEFVRISQECDMVFFDPDNGLEIKSKRKGQKDSCKYLYWDELQPVYASGKSVFLYQHFRREKRENTVSALSEQAMSRLGAPKVLPFRTPHVLFLLIPQENQLPQFDRMAQEVADLWHPEIKVEMPFSEKIPTVPDGLL